MVGSALRGDDADGLVLKQWIKMLNFARAQAKMHGLDKDFPRYAWVLHHGYAVRLRWQCGLLRRDNDYRMR